MATIEVDGLTKDYGPTRAVSELTVTVTAGEIYGLLGPNGAGKSTTIGMLIDHVVPTRGQAQVLGYDTQTAPLEIRRRAGVLGQSAVVDPRLTGRRQVAFALSAHEQLRAPAEVLGRVGLGEAADRSVGSYSAGMRQRLRIGLALVGDPAVLILDEPASGLDPNGQRWLRELLRAERERGTTVFVSSHRLAQLEAIVDRVGILVDGRLRAEGSPTEIQQQVGSAASLEDAYTRLTGGAQPCDS